MSMNTILALTLTSGVFGADPGAQWNAGTAVRAPVQSYSAALPYGACECAEDAMMYVRQDTLSIAASPYVSYHGSGMHDYRRAQHSALRDMGLILSVRTHVKSDHKAPDYKEVEPRGVIHIKERFSAPKEQHANAAARSTHGLTRVVRPNDALAAK
jgi:hypothetical protein